MCRYEITDNLNTPIMSYTKFNDEITLVYNLYRAEINYESRCAYAIEIISLLCGQSDYAVFSDITSEEKRAHEIFEIISSNFVTPCTLSEILEDIL